MKLNNKNEELLASLADRDRESCSVEDQCCNLLRTVKNASAEERESLRVDHPMTVSLVESLED